MSQICEGFTGQGASTTETGYLSAYNLYYCSKHAAECSEWEEQKEDITALLSDAGSTNLDDEVNTAMGNWWNGWGASDDMQMPQSLATAIGDGSTEEGHRLHTEWVRFKKVALPVYGASVTCDA